MSDMMNILEPCCYVKQLHGMLTSATGGHARAVHYGDITVKHLLDRAEVMNHGEATLYVALPAVADYTLCCLRHTLDMLYHNSKSGKAEHKFPWVNIITGTVTDKLLLLAENAGYEMGEPRVRLAKDAGLSFRMLGYRSASPFIATGGILQQVQYGTHMLDFDTSQERCVPLFDLLDSQMRVHRVPVHVKPNR